MLHATLLGNNFRIIYVFLYINLFYINFVFIYYIIYMFIHTHTHISISIENKGNAMDRTNLTTVKKCRNIQL